jgi:hypothetical protein
VGNSAGFDRRCKKRRQVRSARNRDTVATLTDGKFCRYDGKDLEAIGTARQHSVLNDLSSLVVHAGSGDEAKVKATKAKEARKAGLPQRGQIDVLDETSFDQFLTVLPRVPSA